MNDPPKEPPDHVESKTGSKSVQDNPISATSSLSTSSDAILDLKKKKKKSKTQKRREKRKAAGAISPADKDRPAKLVDDKPTPDKPVYDNAVEDQGLDGLASLMDEMERIGEQPTFSVVAGKKIYNSE